MKSLTFLLLWLAVLTLAFPAQAADSSPKPKPIALTFTLPAPLAAASPPSPSSPPASPPPPRSPAPTPLAAASLDSLFAGDSNSLVAKAVGAAEGTRTPDGNRNPAYYGHVDPGNGVWNLGSFSYQHAAASPEEADAKQLDRLRQQASLILEQASQQGLDLTLEEKLNGIDLANQAPKAALDRAGYVDWLVQAKQEGRQGEDAVLSARVRSFLNPETKRWDAPGLGNSEKRITADQARRMDAIARAIDYQQQVVVGEVTPPLQGQRISENPPDAAGINQLFAQRPLNQFEQQTEQQTAPVIEKADRAQELPGVPLVLDLDLSPR
jgi:hypothetical protein